MYELFRDLSFIRTFHILDVIRMTGEVAQEELFIYKYGIYSSWLI